MKHAPGDTFIECRLKASGRRRADEAASPAELLAAIVLSAAAQNGNTDDVRLVDSARSLAWQVGWYPVWDVLLGALAKAIASGDLVQSRDGIAISRKGWRRLARLMTIVRPQIEPGISPPFRALQRRSARSKRDRHHRVQPRLDSA